VDHDGVGTWIEAGDDEGNLAVAARVDNEATDLDEPGIVRGRHLVGHRGRDEVRCERVDLAREGALATGPSRDPGTCRRAR